MNYKEYRENIKTGDVIAYSLEGTGVLNQLILAGIRISTMSEFNHVGLAVVLNDRVMLLEATRPYSRLYPLSKTGSFFHIPMSVKINDNRNLFRYIGLPYSYSKAVASLWKAPDPNSYLRVDGVFCTELCVRGLREYNFCIDYRNGSTPGEFVERCLELSEESKSVFINNESSGSW